MKITFIDTGALILAFRGDSATRAKALAILEDPEREFASSYFIQLELLPKTIAFKNAIEHDFYQEFFSIVKHRATVDQALLDSGFQHASKDGLNGMDALHIAAAVAVKAEELITSEGERKSIHRSKAVKIRSLRSFA